MHRQAKLTWYFDHATERVYDAITVGDEAQPGQEVQAAREDAPVAQGELLVSVTDRTRPSRCAMRIRSASCTVDWSCELEASPGGCKAVFRERVEYPGTVNYLLSWLYLSPRRELDMFAKDLSAKLGGKQPDARERFRLFK